MPVVICVFENSPPLTNSLKKKNIPHPTGRCLCSHKHQQSRKERLSVIKRSNGEITRVLYRLVIVATCVVPRQQNCPPCSLDTPQLHRLWILRPLYLRGCSGWMAAGLLNVLPCSPSPHSRILKLTSTLNCLSTGLTFFLLVNRSFFLQNSRYNLHFSGFLPFSTSSVIQWHKKYETNGGLLTMLTAVQVFLSL